MRVRRSILLVAGASVLLAGPASAQSLLSAGGLGLPVEPVDARSHALGGLGLGLFGPAVVPTAPAAAADLLAPEVSFTLVQSWADLEGPANPTAGGARFPVIGVAYPLFGVGFATLTFAGMMDQRWQGESEGQIDLAGETVNVTDRFDSDGGVSAVRLGFARRISPALAIGFNAGVFTGDLTRTFSRSFDVSTAGPSIPSLTSRGIWSYEGPTLGFGAQWDIGEFFRAAGTVTWSGQLDANPVDDTDGRGEEYDIPTEYRLGVSGALLPSLTLVLGATYANWEGFVDGSDEGRSTLGFGVGLELGDVRLVGRETPIRLGYRRKDLPFRFDGADATESALTGGLGINLAQFGDVPLARMDLAIEKGSRSAGPISESFWRAVMTIRVAGN
jgi:hypothetical protein